MQIALFKLEQGQQKECNKLLEDGKTTLDSMTDIDPSVYASFYWVSSQYYKARQEFAEFYKSALLYLAYTSVDSLSESFRLVIFILICLHGPWILMVGSVSFQCDVKYELFIHVKTLMHILICQSFQ